MCFELKKNHKWVIDHYGYGYITIYYLAITSIKIYEQGVHFAFLKHLKDGTFEEDDLVID